MKTSIRIKQAKLDYRWEDADIPGHPSCDIDIVIRFTAYPTEPQTHWTPGWPASAEIERIDVNRVILYDDHGEPLDIDGRAVIPESEILVGFWARHEESSVVEMCLESIE